MADFPAKCTVCGHTFKAANLIGGGSVENLTLKGVSTNCPRCGGRAELLDGTYEMMDDTAHLVSSSDVNLEELRHLLTILEEVGSEQEAKEALEAELGEAHPDVLVALRELKEGQRKGSWTSNMLAVVSIAISLRTGSPPPEKSAQRPGGSPGKPVAEGLDHRAPVEPPDVLNVEGMTRQQKRRLDREKKKREERSRPAVEEAMAAANQSERSRIQRDVERAGGMVCDAPSDLTDTVRCQLGKGHEGQHQAMDSADMLWEWDD